MKALSVIGITKSGKTETIENIIKELKRRRYSVGSIKEIHYEKFAIDTEGTNTYRHRAAGAGLVTARGYYETDILYPSKLPIEDILKFYVQDYVIMEGVSDYNVPVILCAKRPKDLEEHRDKEYFSRVFLICGVISNKKKNSYEGIPIINALSNITEVVDIIIEKIFDVLPDYPPHCCSECGYSCRELCSRILKGKSKRSDCKISQADIVLSIDGKKIGMVPFVKSMLRDTIKALAGNLKGYKKGKKIEITIND